MMTMQGSVQESIHKNLSAQLELVSLTVENESHQHAGPADAETHFKIVCVAKDFDGLSRVKRHQAVYKILAEQLSAGVHALALHLYSPDEWQQRSTAPESPPCMGGSKRA